MKYKQMRFSIEKKAKEVCGTGSDVQISYTITYEGGCAEPWNLPVEYFEEKPFFYREDGWPGTLHTDDGRKFTFDCGRVSKDDLQYIISQLKKSGDRLHNICKEMGARGENTVQHQKKTIIKI